MLLNQLTSISHTWFCRCWHLLSSSCALSKRTHTKDEVRIKSFLSRNSRLIKLCRCYLILSEASVCPPRLKSACPLEESLKWECDMFDVWWGGVCIHLALKLLCLALHCFLQQGHPLHHGRHQLKVARWSTWIYIKVLKYIKASSALLKMYFFIQ